MILKTTYTYVVYHEQDDVPLDLRHALSEAMDGSMIGGVAGETTKPVNPDTLKQELISIGNDGTFFDPV